MMRPQNGFEKPSGVLYTSHNKPVTYGPTGRACQVEKCNIAQNYLTDFEKKKKKQCKQEMLLANSIFYLNLSIKTSVSLNDIHTLVVFSRLIIYDGAYRVLTGRPEGKRPLRRPRRRWEDNIKLELREIGIGGANCIGLA
jgi:hypothetical protein